MESFFFTKINGSKHSEPRRSAGGRETKAKGQKTEFGLVGLARVGADPVLGAHLCRI
jgi:hypothetical protein